MFSIQTENRDAKISPASLRGTGKIPAVVYGAGTPTTQITIDLKEFKKVFAEAGESGAITLTLDGKKVSTLVHDVQYEPIRGEVTHVDFLVVDMNKPITVSVPLEFIGVAPAVKSGAGTLVKVMHEIELEALPKDLPQSVSIDIGTLDTIDSNITVSDIVLPKGVTAVTKATDIVAAIAEQKEEVEEVAPIDLSQIAVEKKGKKEEVEAEA